MNGEDHCNTTLGLGIQVEVNREKKLKQNSRGMWLDLSLPVHPKTEAGDHGDDDDHVNDEEKDDQDSFSSKIIDEHEKEEERRMKRSDFSNDDLYHDNTSGSRKKLKLTAEQIWLLEDSFKQHCTLNTGQKQELAEKLRLLPRQIEVWFQNRRARTKLKQIEQECILLKKYCETLSDENRRLKKELREAVCCSLKHQQQFQPPQHPLPLYIQWKTTMEEGHRCYKIEKTDDDDDDEAAVIQHNCIKKNVTPILL